MAATYGRAREGGKRQLDTVRKTMTKGLQILPDTFIPLYKPLIPVRVTFAPEGMHFIFYHA